MIINRSMTDGRQRYVSAPHIDYPNSTSAIWGVWVSDEYDVEWIYSGNVILGYNLVPKTEQARIAHLGPARI